MDVIRHRIRAGGYRRRKGQEEKARGKNVSAGDLQANHEGLKPPAWFSNTTISVIAFYRVV
jgi:hypothetical protein